MIVHRQLAASLGLCPSPSLTPTEIEAQAQHCNDKKYAAKACSDASDETFFGLFVKECGPIEEKAVVIGVLDAAFDVLVYKYGIVKRVYMNVRVVLHQNETLEAASGSGAAFRGRTASNSASDVEDEPRASDTHLLYRRRGSLIAS